jgi:hypothetical protein
MSHTHGHVIRIETRRWHNRHRMHTRAHRTSTHSSYACKTSRACTHTLYVLTLVVGMRTRSAHAYTSVGRIRAVRTRTCCSHIHIPYARTHMVRMHTCRTHAYTVHTHPVREHTFSMPTLSSDARTLVVRTHTRRVHACTHVARASYTRLCTAFGHLCCTFAPSSEQSDMSQAHTLLYRTHTCRTPGTYYTHADMSYV